MKMEMDKIELLREKARFLSSNHPLGLIIEKTTDLLQELIKINMGNNEASMKSALESPESCSMDGLNSARDNMVLNFSCCLRQCLTTTATWIVEKERSRGVLTNLPLAHAIKTEITEGDADNLNVSDVGHCHWISRNVKEEQSNVALYSANSGPDAFHASAETHKSDEESEEEDEEDRDTENAVVKRKKKHSIDQSWDCEICQLSFTTAGTLRVHKLTHLEDYMATHPYPCDQCDKRFTQAGSLSVHKRTHMDKNDPRLLKYKQIWTCDVCQKQFKQRCGLHAHKKSHLGKNNPEEAEKKLSHKCNICDRGERPFQCKVCPKDFASKSRLKNHEKNHEKGTAHVERKGVMKSRNHNCTLCPRRFTGPNHLAAHLKRHAGGLPYPCPRCDVQYRFWRSLENHLQRNHKVEMTIVAPKPQPRPFNCEHCSATFTTEFAMEQHMKLHAGPSSFKCARCSMELSTFSQLEEHKRAAHDPLPYECKHCALRVSSLEELVKHKDRCAKRLRNNRKQPA